MLKGDVFINQHFPVNTFSAFIDTFLNGECGIKEGYKNSFEVTNTANALTVNSGLACVKGRFFREDSSTTIEFSSVGLVYCRLVVEIDLSKTNTTDELNQLAYKIIYSGESYPTLVQEDTVLNERGKYQFELASFMCNSNGISGFVDKRTYLDFDSIYEEVREAIREIENGSIFALKGKKLWENPNPSSNTFSPQTITLEANNFDFFRIIYRAFPEDTNPIVQDVRVGDNFRLAVITPYTPGVYDPNVKGHMKVCMRMNNTSSQTSIYFGEDISYRSDQSTKEVRTGMYSIPLEVYGMYV
ncbi:MAG: hypothetical protein K6D97_03675 [Clostridia bacterium]|nr:hypothetical protein [Clostridia bacterium]